MCNKTKIIVRTTGKKNSAILNLIWDIYRSYKFRILLEKLINLLKKKEPPEIILV